MHKTAKALHPARSINRSNKKFVSDPQPLSRQSSLYPTEYSLELRQRVERLESERADAWSRNDRDAVDQIDSQIRQVIVAWTDSFIGDFEWRYRKMG